MAEPRPLVDAVRELAVGAVALAGDVPGGRAADVAAEVARLQRGAATVVVAGEPKRGKSSLVNALVGVPGLLPVDVDVATSTYVVVGHASRPRAAVVEDGNDDPQGRPIDPAEIGRYAALDPQTGGRPPDDVLHVRVGLPAPLLDHGLELIDTPGVGGLVGGHGELTLTALAAADSLLFVVSGSGELTASECAFLGRATERLADVRFVLSQTDKYPRWREVLDRDRLLVGRHAPRFGDAPWFAVSGKMQSDADRARAGGRGALADRLGATSGVPELGAALATQVADRAAQVRLRNVVAVAALAVGHARDSARHLADALEEGDVDAARFALIDRLRAVGDTGATWRQTVVRRVQKLQHGLTLLTGRRLDAVRDAVAQVVTSGAGADVPTVLDAQLRAVWTELESTLRAGLSAIVEEVVAEFGSAAGTSVLATALPAELQELPGITSGTAEQGGIGGAVDRLVPSIGIGSLTASIGIHLLGGALLLPLSAGAGAVWLMAQRRKRREDLLSARGDALRYLGQVIGRAHAEMPAVLRDVADTVSEELQEAVVAWILQHRRALEHELAEHDAATRRDARTREAQLAEVRRRLAICDASLGRAAELARALSP